MVVVQTTHQYLVETTSAVVPKDFETDINFLSLSVVVINDKPNVYNLHYKANGRYYLFEQLRDYIDLISYYKSISTN